MNNQIELICRAAYCKPEDLVNLTTLYAWGNSGITDAGIALVSQRRKKAGT